jgi:protein required for attachment to host cells
MPTDSRRDPIESLIELGRQYRHYQQEHDRHGPDSALRHRLRAKMQRLRGKFDKLIARWVQDEAVRDAWTRYLHEGGSPPEEPRGSTPPVFKGVTEAGSTVEVRPTEDRGYDLVVDGAVIRHETVPWHLDPDIIEPIQIAGYKCREVCDAPPQALRELAAFLATPESEPPWRWVRALTADGLVDANLALTPRGYRLLGKGAPQPLGAPTPVTYGVLAADAARARLFVLHTTNGGAPTVSPIVEVAQTTNPDRRARNSELFADTRPGLSREGPHGPRHGVSDRRDRHRRDAERRFAAEISKDALRLWRAHGVTRVILVASPSMLGLLRAAAARTENGPRSWSVRELARDLTRLAPPALHDALAADGYLPPRGRLPSARPPAPGIPL